MRLSIVGAGGPAKTETAIAFAARTLGYRCQQVDAVWWRRRIGPAVGALVRWRISAFNPDLVLFTRPAGYLGLDVVRALARGRRSVLWYFDPVVPPRDDVLALACAVDALYLTYPAQIPLYRAAGVREVHFLPQGLHPGIDRPAASASPRLTCDVAFVGSGQWPGRHELLRAIAESCELQIRGPGWNVAPASLPVMGGPVRGRRFAQVVRGARISLGADAFPDPAILAGGGTSNRIWKVLGCGGFFLGGWSPGIERLARDGEHCAYYRGVDQARAQVRRYLAEPELRAEIARAGRAHALAHHTYAHRLPLLLAGEDYIST